MSARAGGAGGGGGGGGGGTGSSAGSRRLCEDEDDDEVAPLDPASACLGAELDPLGFSFYLAANMPLGYVHIHDVIILVNDAISSRLTGLLPVNNF